MIAIAGWAIESGVPLMADSPVPRPLPKGYRDVDYSLSPEEARTVRILEVVTSVWFLAIGCCVGSFLNVVVYREPRGLAIVLPRSRCPKCQNAIAPRDNIPVIGWLRLRGKCRTCQLPIAARYPLVEMGVGLLFLALMHLTLLSGGGNLPVREINSYKGVVWILWYTKWDLVGFYFFHLLLLIPLWAAALIEHDGFHWPKRLIVFTGVAGLGMLILWPHLHPIPALYTAGRWGTVLHRGLGAGIPLGWRGPAYGLLGAIAAGATAWFAATLLRWQTISIDQSSAECSLPGNRLAPRWQLTVTAALVGLYLGWQTGVAVSLALVLCLSLLPHLQRHTVAWSAGLTTLIVFFWRQLSLLVTSLVASSFDLS